MVLFLTDSHIFGPIFVVGFAPKEDFHARGEVGGECQFTDSIHNSFSSPVQGIHSPRCKQI